MHEMSKTLIPCFVCEKELENYHVNQPDDGLEFTSVVGGIGFRTPGHYGSTFFDPEDRSSIAINICDECLEKGKHKILYYKPVPIVKADPVPFTTTKLLLGVPK